VESPVSSAGSGSQATKPIAVFLLDDHEVVRRGVRDLLEAEPDITVVGEASTASSALARIPALRPDVAILDVRLPDGDGVSVCREIRSRMPEVGCLMLTSFDDDEALPGGRRAGEAATAPYLSVADRPALRACSPCLRWGSRAWLAWIGARGTDAFGAGRSGTPVSGLSVARCRSAGGRDRYPVGKEAALRRLNDAARLLGL
jgi:CheY-like chemotaxis protein